MNKELNQQLAKNMKTTLNTFTALSIIKRNHYMTENGVTKNPSNYSGDNIQNYPKINVDQYIKDHIGFGG